MDMAGDEVPVWTGYCSTQHSGQWALPLRTTVLTLYQSFKQKLLLKTCRACADVPCLLHAKNTNTRPPWESHASSLQKLGDKKVLGYQGPFNLVRIDTSQNQRRKTKPANTLSLWHVEIIGFSCILYRVKSLIKLYGSLWAKFCHAGILMLPLYVETEQSIQQRIHRMVWKLIGLSCGLSPSETVTTADDLESVSFWSLPLKLEDRFSNVFKA